MATPARPGRGNTAADLLSWLKEEVSAVIADKTEIVAHGGTALTLLEVKGSTKDVDFGFRSREDFARFSDALKTIGYRVAFDSQPGRGEVFLMLENPQSVIDAVDLRFPTWNNWHLAGGILNHSISIPLGQVSLIRPDINAVFLFKTYPMRDTDLDDLGSVLDKTSLDERRVTSLFDEQDEIYRRVLMQEDIEYEPLFNVLEMRARYAGSLALLGARYRRLVPEISSHANAKFEELKLRFTLDQVIQEIREGEKPVNWDDILNREDFEALRKELVR